MGVRHQTRICGHDSVDVRINLNHFRRQGRTERGGRGIAAATPQGRQIAILGNPLKTADNGNLARLELGANTRRVDV
jgi:hypothetical protein